uniref:Uncharacterized protein n=1 Tax=viral metagenome TaxID=1070528 RepID=A0A6M3LVH0_9ZZZZ
MQITLKFTSTSIKHIEYYLRRRYKSKAGLEKLAKLAILTEVANQARKELEEM